MSPTKLMKAVAYAALIPLTAVAMAAGFPAGDYEGGGATLNFARDGTYRVLQGTQAMVIGTYKTAGTDKIVLTDVSGEFACTPASNATGTYAWHIEGDALTLKKVKDACDDRSSDLAATIWRKK